MLMAAATRRASCRSSIEQQLPNEVSPSLWSYSCIDSPMTSCPCSSSRAAATDESTPPDMATTIRMVDARKTRKRMVSLSCVSWIRWSHQHRLFRQAAQLLDQARQHLDDAVHFLVVRKQAEAEPQRVLRAMRRQAHRAQHV